ncbi:MAG: SLBB domain-containing protein, partial [Synergistaceae bacterium]|nr:SLBB domain-containing protein [Synergistaceae bacterium]
MIYIDDKTKKQIFLVSGVLCLAAVCAAAVLSGAGKDRTETGRIAAETVPDEYFAEPEPEVWVVYVTGEVILPGVYELSPGSRVNDAVRSAGGFTSRADRNSVNLAAKLRDEAHIA